MDVAGGWPGRGGAVGASGAGSPRTGLSPALGGGGRGAAAAAGRARPAPLLLSPPGPAPPLPVLRPRSWRPASSPAMRPAGLCGAAPLAVVALLVLGVPPALAGEDCLWYVDRNGSWHPGFNCEFFTFCCGTCHQRYCCRDLSLLITERQQKHCLAFSPKTIAGIASAVILFVAVVATTICCFLCSCCYLYRRRQQLQSPFEGQEIPMTGIPVQPVYPYPQDPKAGPAPPEPGFMYPPSGPVPQYPAYPAGPPIYNPAAPPPYMPPQPSYPGA